MNKYSEQKSCHPFECEELFETFTDRSPLRFTWPGNLIVGSRIILNGMKLNRENRTEERDTASGRKHEGRQEL